jgi:glutamate dehydrogenase/leucine dehydrogenase
VARLPAAGAAVRPRESVWQRYAAFLRRPPLVALEWHDAETPARGWLVINSLRGGAAGGGTRMRAGLGRREVVYLAKTMELKFLFSGPPIGGAKSGIDFDPADPRRRDVLRRWFQAIAPYLHACYGTGGDLNVDEMLDVIPACEEIGLAHPQEGVVRGHRQPEPAALARVLEALDRGVAAEVGEAYGIRGCRLSVADMVTGFGVARSIVHAHRLLGRSVEGARVLVEGFGAVGAPCALYLARAGARIVGISDRDHLLIDPEGIDADGMAALMSARRDKLLPGTDPRCTRRTPRHDWGGVRADVFVAAAASGTVDREHLSMLEARGVGMLACGANQPFREASLGATAVQREADARFTVIADVVSNCGMARAFSHLMEEGAMPDPAAIFPAVDRTIGGALEEIMARSGRGTTGMLAATLGHALDRIEAEAPAG